MKLPTKAAIRSYMRTAVGDHAGAYGRPIEVNKTALAEDALAHFDLLGKLSDGEETVFFDLALEVTEEAGYE